MKKLFILFLSSAISYCLSAQPEYFDGPRTVYVFHTITYWYNGSSGGGGYWNISGTGAFIQSSDADYAQVYISAAGTFYLTHTNSIDGDKELFVTAYSVPPTPAAPFISSTQCAQVTIQMNTAQIPADTEWFWQTTPNGKSTSLGSYYQHNITASGTYYLQSRNTYSPEVWGGTSSGITVSTIPPRPVDGIITASQSSICLGQPVTIYGSGGTGVPHYWASTNGGSSWNVFADAHVGESSFSFTPTSIGTYRFHLRNRTDYCGFCWDAGNSCTTYPYVDVVVTAAPSTAGDLYLINEPDQNVCVGSNVQIGVQNSPGTQYYWIYRQNGATWENYEDAYNAGNPFTYYFPVAGNWKIETRAENQCGMSSVLASINLTVWETPSTPTIYNVNPVCYGQQATLSATTGSNGNGVRWYDAATGGSPLNSYPYTANHITPALYASRQYWVSSYHTVGCEGSRFPINVTVSQLPTPSNAGPNQTSASTCGLTSVTMAANTPGAGTGNWSIASGSGGSFANASNPSSTFTGLAGSMYVLRWTISNNPCTPSMDDVTITFHRNPTTANAGPDQTGSATCGLTNITLSANTHSVGTGSWIIVSGTGGSIGNAASATSTFTGTPGNAYVLRWTISNSPCASSSDDVNITFNRNPTPANAGPDQTGSTTCGLTSTTLAGNTPTIGTGSWSIITGIGGSLGSASSASSTFSGTPGVLYVLQWTISNNPCTSSTDNVNIAFNVKPVNDPAVTGNSRFGDGPLSLVASGAQGSESYKWYTPSNGLLFTGSPYPTPPVSAPAANYCYVQVVNAQCSSLSTWVNVDIYPIPVITSDVSRVHMGIVANLTTGAYDSYVWKDGSGNVIGLDQTVQIGTPGFYTTTVTKDGLSHTPAPFELPGQLDGLSENYIVAHTIQKSGVSSLTGLELREIDEVSQAIRYFDGLGRAMQTVSTQASPLKNDIVQPVVYDSYGREAKKYLPFSAGNDGRYKANSAIISSSTGDYIGMAATFYNDPAAKIADDGNMPFSEMKFEASPLNRIIKQGAPGETWQPNSNLTDYSDKTIKREYVFNSTNEVLLWTYDPATHLVSAKNGGTLLYYQPNKLYVNKTFDEHNNLIKEYIDKQGRTILKRVQATTSQTPVNDTNFASTYYIYDAFGNLVTVLPPEAVSKLGTSYHNATVVNQETFLNNWTFRYKYDSRKRMTEKIVPGTLPVYIVYDNRDRLVLTQNGNQRAGTIKYWTFTKYDDLNRPILTGIKDTICESQTAMQAVVNAHYQKNWAKWGESYIGNAATNIHGYSNKSYPTTTSGSHANSDFLTVTYYDNYTFRNQWPEGYSYVDEGLEETANGVLYSQPENEFLNVKGFVTGTKVKVLDGGVKGGYTWLKSVSYYDDRYRTIQTLSENYKGGADRTTNVFDFIGKVLKTKTTHIERDITWQDRVGVELMGNKLRRIIGGNSWTQSGAASVQQLPPGVDGWVEANVNETNMNKAFGFNDVNAGVDLASMDYAFQMIVSNGYKAVIYENSNLKATLIGDLAPTDVLRIERSGTTVKYYRNGILEYTSATASNTVLMADASIYTQNANIVLRCSFSTSPISVIRRFEYDHAGRLLKIWHKLDTQPEILLTKNEYNELGQLVDKKLHSTLASGVDAKQSVDSRYNIRGWLTSINNSQLANNTVNDDVNDLFGMNLGYNEDLGTGNAANLQYNGNISAISYSTNLALGSEKELGYNFTYDPLNRLQHANHRKNDNIITPNWTAGSYNENNLTYDLNGNIKTLQRTGDANLQIDNLTYNYGSGAAISNKLLFVMDGTVNTTDKAKGFSDGSTSGNDYTYDGNGNMLTDKNKNITSNITYNFLNLPEKVTRNNSSVTYIYDAAGRKLAQTAAYATAQKQTDYVGEFLYENDALQFINHEEGRIVIQGSMQVLSDDGSSADAYTPSANFTTTAQIINGETYVKVIPSVGIIPSKLGTTPIGSIIPVTAGERYVYRVKGYCNSTRVANLYVKGNSADIIWSGANLPTNPAGQMWVENSFTVPAGVTQITLGVLYSSGATTTASDYFYINDVELKKLTETDPEYQYHLKDHLGNVRLTFTAKDEVESKTATLEPAQAADERSAFIHYDEAVIVNHEIFDRTNDLTPTGTTNATRLVGGNTNSVYGLTRSLSVMPGDQISMEVYAKYLDPQSANWEGPFETFLTQFTSSTPPAGTIVDGGLAGSIGNTAFPYTGLILKEGVSEAAPKAFLNWIVFDRNFNPIIGESGFMQIGTDAKENGTNVDHKRLARATPLLIREPGYVYIYLSNENATEVEVYFDDMKVEHVKSPVVQMDDYYPFGLSFNSYSRENSVGQKYLYNGMELQDELSLNWLDYGARMYDPAIARWMVADPLSDKARRMSPYSYVYNNPLIFVDPDGMFGEYYAKDGKYLGTDGIDDKKVYTADKATTTTTKAEDGTETTTTTFENAEEIGVESDFVDMNGKTISSETTKKNLVGLAIYLRNEEGVEGAKVTVQGGDRDAAKNKKVGGSTTSPHMAGTAADISVSGMTNETLAIAAGNSGLFTGVIYYPAWGDTDGFGTHIEQREGQIYWDKFTYDVTAPNYQTLAPHVHVDNRPGTGVNRKRYKGDTSSNKNKQSGTYGNWKSNSEIK